jgi:hypothetical protein
METSEDFEALNERKKYYQFFDDDTILTLTQYYNVDRKKELLRFIKDNCMKGDDISEA